MEVYGVEGSVLISFNGTLPDLAVVLSRSLNLPEFRLDTDQDPPHNQFGSVECLGFEISLNSETQYEGYNFVLIIESENCLEELMAGRMHDVSIWFSNYLQLINDETFNVKPL